MFVRPATAADRRAVWALDAIPNIGATADPDWPLDMPRPERPPAAFPDLAEVPRSFTACGGDFLVVEQAGRLVGMGGFRPRAGDRAEVLRVRVHPATRRQGVGSRLMSAIEDRARALGIHHLDLDTATNQPEAVAFYRALGYVPVLTERRPCWSWTLVHFTKAI